MTSRTDFYDRGTLYEEVWAEPVYKVAERYGVTDKAIAKACKKMHIPVPERGYWNKVNAGQALAKPPLPDFKGCPKVRRLYIQPESVVEKAPERLVPEAFALEKEVLRKEALPEMKIMYRPDVKLSNRYVLNTEKNLQNSLKRKPGNYEFGRCNSRDDDAFEVSVGPDSIPRALAILQILCDALETRGYPIGPQEDPKEKQEHQNGYQQRKACPIYAKVLDTYVRFKITESSFRQNIAAEHRTSSYASYEYVPSGKLCFELVTSTYNGYVRNKWQDGKNLRVENQMNDFIVNMIRAVTIQKEHAVQNEIRHKQWLVEEEKRREQERLEQIDKKRIGFLIKETEKMVNLNQIRDYIAVITEEGKRRLGENYSESDFAKWVDWAEQFLEKNDYRSWKLPKFDLSDKYYFVI